MSFTSTLADFGRDERGVFAVMFGLMAIVLVAVGGAVVDYVLLENRRSALQISLDTAALALQREIRTKSSDQIRASAQGVVDSHGSATGYRAEVVDATIDRDSGSLRLTASLEMDTLFVSLVGVPRLGATVQSEVTRKATRIEIAMVLDNSGSMKEQSRMVRLKEAARNAVDIFLEDSNPADPRVHVGIVPFTQYVNVGKRNANEPWIDRFGVSPIAGDNLMIDPQSPVMSYNRLALHNQMGGEGWRGCVEARPYPHDTTDTPPTTASPQTLFVPLLAPDEPDRKDWLGRDYFNNNYLTDGRATCEAPPRWQTWTDRVLQERMCKYRGATPTNLDMDRAKGPNADCPRNALTPLTASKNTLRNAIAAMVPEGGTNIAQGAVWGFHMLTPGAPLAEAKASTPEQTVNKVMILMTDGDNFHAANPNMNGSTYYTAYGYPHNRRLGKPGDSTAELQELMDDRLKETCANTKAANITIYTIGLGLSREKTKEMLQNCSNGGGHWFLPKEASELNGIFETIANQLSELRLSR